MGNHITDDGKFQSDLHPELPPDKMIVSFKDKRAHNGLLQIAYDYQTTDNDLSRDIRIRVKSIQEGK